jgi:hypothetical protein
MNRHTLPSALAISIFLCIFLASQHPGFVAAQSDTGQVQQITGRLEPGENHVYLLNDLQPGDRIVASMKSTSGNLDPALGISDTSQTVDAAFAQYQAEARQILASSSDVAQAINDLRDRFFLAWDDDGGDGYAAELEFTIPAAGDYRIFAGASLSALGRVTAGDYELVISRNAQPGETEPTGAPFVTPEQFAGGLSPVVGQASGTVTSQVPAATVRLADIRAGEKIYVNIQPTSGSLIPAVILRDFGGKPLQAANAAGQEPQAKLEYTFPEDAVGHTLEIQGASGPDGAATTGDFQALVGLNAPDVLTGQATITEGRAIIKQPIQVQVGIKMERISGVNSQDENFTVLGSIRMDWVDPALAFSPDSCNCTVKIFTEKEFDRFLADVQSRWPDFVFFNQLGNRWVQSRSAVIWSDGRARFGESFTTTFQADFDFRQFPFDVQEFPIFVDMLFPADTYVLADLPGYSAISSEHGEDEFIITDFTTQTSLEAGRIADNPVSRFSFTFNAPRHMEYYILQVFVPIFLIILISWFTFFLKDYTRRIEAAAANILLFIAFSFSLADNYPRLGYVTFLDAVMAVTFAVNTLVLLYNVYMKRLENDGRIERVDRIDNFFDWAYPLLYVVLIGIVVVWFF